MQADGCRLELRCPDTNGFVVLSWRWVVERTFGWTMLKKLGNKVMIIRRYKVEDTKEIMELFYDTVHEINIKDYSKEQVEAWAPKDMMNYEIWKNRLKSKITYVAEDKGSIAGFGELEESGHIDCFYCHKNYQRQGVGSQLFKVIEEMAKSIGIKRLFTEASITAKPFFESKGFQTVRQQEVERSGERLINYVMEKKIQSRL